MRTEDLRTELKNKERSVSDLLRHIRTRTEDSNPNYSLLLGAGGSVSSDIRTGKELVEEWRQDIFSSFEENKGKEYDEQKAKAFLSANCGSWYNPHNEYTSLFEKKYDLPRQRRIFVEQEVAGKIPSLGYAYLTKLVKHQYFNAIFTTNFDDLVNEAFYQYSDQRPIVCAHDSSISSVTVTSKRPKLVKLHGDYLFDDLKSTLRETESLEKNMKEKFIEFAKDYGLVVVGYGGHDRSIMDVLSYLLKHDDYYKNGIYWCLRPGAYITEELRKLLWKERAFYVVVDGFDELFAEFNHTLFNGDLPIETSLISEKSKNLISGFVKNQRLRESASQILRDDVAKLERQSKRDTLFDLIKQTTSEDSGGKLSQSYSDTELILIISVEELISKNQYAAAIVEGRKHLATEVRQNVRVKLLRLLAAANRRLGNIEQAAAVWEELIEIQPRNPAHFISKSRVITGGEKRLALLDKALKLDAYYSDTYTEKAALLIQSLSAGGHDDFQKKYDEIISVFNISLECNPNITNPCWEDKFEFVRKSKSKIKPEKPGSDLGSIVDELKKQNPNHPKVLRMMLDLMPVSAGNSDVAEFLAQIRKARDDQYRYRRWAYDHVLLDVFAKFNMTSELKECLAEIESNDEFKKDVDFLEVKARLLLTKLDRLEDAINMLEQALEIAPARTFIKLLATWYGYAQLNDKRKALIEKYEQELGKKAFLALMFHLYEDAGNYPKAKEYIERLKGIADWPYEYLNDEVYLLLLAGNYEEAHQLLRKYLEVVKFRPDKEVALLNYELSLLKTARKIRKEKLGTMYQSGTRPIMRAVAAVLLGEKENAFLNIEEALREDSSKKYRFRYWPAFESIKNDARFIQICSQSPTESKKGNVLQLRGSSAEVKGQGHALPNNVN